MANEPINPNDPANIPIKTPGSKSFSEKMAEIDKLHSALKNPNAPIPPVAPGQPTATPSPAPVIPVTPGYETMPSTSGSGENFLTYLFSQQITFIVLGIIAVLVIGGVIYYFTTAGSKGTIEISFNEIPDTISVGSDSYPPAETITLQLKSGTYPVQATKKNYYPLNSSIEVQSKTTNQISLELIAYPKPQELVEYPTLFPHLNPQENEIFYLSNYGTTFYKMNLSNFTKDTLSPNYFYHIDNVVWAPSARPAGIVTSTNNPEIHSFQTENVLYQKNREEDETIFHFYDFSKYDLITQSHSTYPANVKNPTWHPTKEEIVFHYIDEETGENALFKASPSNIDGRERLLDLDFVNALPVFSPDKEMIAIIDTEPASTQSNPIFIYYTVSRNFDKLPTKDTYTNLLWSPDSTKLIGIKKDFRVSLTDIASGQTKDLPFKANLDHITWLHDNQRLLLSMKQSGDSNDNFVVFDINTGEGTNLDYMPPDKPINSISNLIVNKTDSMIYFTGDTHLYSLPIHLEPVASAPAESPSEEEAE